MKCAMEGVEDGVYSNSDQEDYVDPTPEHPGPDATTAGMSTYLHVLRKVERAHEDRRLQRVKGKGVIYGTIGASIRTLVENCIDGRIMRRTLEEAFPGTTIAETNSEATYQTCKWKQLKMPHDGIFSMFLVEFKKLVRIL